MENPNSSEQKLESQESANSTSNNSASDENTSQSPNQSVKEKTSESKWLSFLPWFLFGLLVLFVVVKKQNSPQNTNKSNKPKKEEPQYPSLESRYYSFVLMNLKSNQIEQDWPGEAIADQLNKKLSEIPGLVPRRRNQIMFGALNRISNNQTAKFPLEEAQKNLEVEHAVVIQVTKKEEKNLTLVCELYSPKKPVQTFTIQSDTYVALITKTVFQLSEVFLGEGKTVEISKLITKPASFERYGKSQVFWSQQNTSKAYFEAKELLKAEPEELLPLINIVLMEQEQKRRKRVFRRTKEILKRNPKEWNALLLQGQLYYEEAIRKGLNPQEREDYWNGAETVLLLALKENPNLFEAYETLGELFYSQKYETFSYNAYKRGFQIRPSLDLAWYCSEYLTKVERFQEAIEIYRTISQVNPLNAEAYLRLGYFLSRLDVFEEAHQQLDKAQKIGALKERVSHYRSFVYFFEGEIEKTTEELKKALKINPKYNEANLTLGYIYKFFSNDPQNAIKYLQAYKNNGGVEASLEPWLEELHEQLKANPPLKVKKE